MDTIRAIIEILEVQRNAQLLNEWRYCTAAKANVEIGQMLPQQMWAIFPTQIEEQIKLDGTKYTTSGIYTLYFLTSQDALDFDAVANVSKQERCLAIAKDFLARLESVKNLRITGTEIKTTLMYSVNDRTCTGVKIELRIEEKQPECLAEADTAVSVECVLSNPTTTTLNVSLYVDSGIKAVIRKGFAYGLNREDQPDEVEMSGNEYTLGGLETGTTYYIKPFVQTNDGITYGEVKKIATQEGYLITTNDPVGVTATGFTTSGIIYTKGDAIEEQGIAYGDHAQPTVDDNKVPVVTVNYDYTKSLTNFPIGSEVYWRAYAKVNGKNNYGNEKYVKLPSYFAHYKYMTTTEIGGNINLTNCYFYQGESNYVKIGYGWDGCIWAYMITYTVNGTALSVANYSNTHINFNTYGGYSGIGENYQLETYRSNSPVYVEYKLTNGIKYMEAKKIAPLPTEHYEKIVTYPVRDLMATPGGKLSIALGGSNHRSYVGELIVKDSQDGEDKLHLLPTIALSDVPSSFEWQGRSIYEGDTGLYDTVTGKFCKAEFTGTNRGVMLNELPF